MIMHFVSNDYNPMNRYISEYALEKYGKLAAISFSVYGISIVLFFLWLKKNLSKKIKSGIETKLVLLFGISILILGFVNTDPKTGPITFYGTIHSLLAGIGILSFSVGSIFISKKLKNLLLKKISWFSLFLFLSILIGAFADILNAHNFVIPELLQIFSNIIGLTERLYFLTVTLWILMLGYYLKKLNYNFLDI